MAPTSKANYKSFEAQARLIRAIVAAHPETKWNYKEIAACYGSDMTADALNHRFRRIRAEATIIKAARQQDLDMKNLKLGDELPTVQGAVDMDNIAKYFGQSTADGIQFQFRAIKSDVKRIRDAVHSGQDVADLPLPGLSGPGGISSVTSTPSKTTPSRATPSRAKGTKRKQVNIKEEFASSDMDDADDDGNTTQDWSEKDADDTPSKKRTKTTGTAGTGSTTPGQKNGTPSRRVASKAAATIAASMEATADLSESYSEPEPLTVRPASIFGNPTPTPAPAPARDNTAFNRGAQDTLIGGGGSFDGDDGGYTNYYEGLNLGGDYEI